jgi:hypothetical protein
MKVALGLEIGGWKGFAMCCEWDQELEKMVNLSSATLNSLLYQYSNALNFYHCEKI